MLTEEIIQEHAPISLELEYADGPRTAPASEREGRIELPFSKKDEILDLYESGTTDVAEIVRKVKARPSYVAQVLQTAGHLSGYFDLYTTTGAEPNVYTRLFRKVLSSKPRGCRESLEDDRLYNYFERLGDRAGQHQAMVIALTGKNRARWSGKLEESKVFSEWLAAH